MALLSVNEKPPFLAENLTGVAPLILVCEHACMDIPIALNDLGLSSSELTSHISWDPGAYKVAKFLSDALDAPLISANYSRLVYDCNRPPFAQNAIPTESAKCVIPGNLELTREDHFDRVQEIYRPFEYAVRSVVDSIADRRDDLVIISIHSFTPIFLGAHRTVEVGILHDADSRLADTMLRYTVDKAVKVARNAPYGPNDGVMHTLKLHALSRNLPNAMIEVKNDLLRTPEDVEKMGAFLKAMIKHGIADLQTLGGEEQCLSSLFTS
ncbi:MAG: N-formylglutamate amidohydrolase [Cocleimonas sp.]